MASGGETVSVDDVDPRVVALVGAACERQGWTVESWRLDEDESLEAVIGRYRFDSAGEHDADEYGGPYDGDEGVLVAQIVGAAEFHNERVSFALRVDDYDSAYDVRDVEWLEAVS